jgi:hypothetical protein
MRKLALLSFAFLICAGAARAQDPGWPRQKTSPAGKLVYYQPQVDEWTNQSVLRFRLAFTLIPTGGQPNVGVMKIEAKTTTNVDAHTVLLEDPVITETHFPSLDAAATTTMDQLARTFMPADASITISLDRLVATVEKSEPSASIPVRNEPPVIFASNRPSILLQLDGEPVLGNIKGTNLQFAVNTNWPLFFDKSTSKYLLFTGKRWLWAAGLKGPWASLTILPRDFSAVARDPQWSGLTRSISPVATESGPPPTVFYSDKPAEVILFNGYPVYAPIAGTQLVYATNTEADLVVDNNTKHYYYLAAGRWFESASLQGPWGYASDKLPADFAKIPVNSPAARVLSAVPGTEAAKDAVLLAQIPTSVTVDPATAAAQVKVIYDGAPAFAPIEGTSLFYATNSADKVIKNGVTYYVCGQGIWFLSDIAEGPWTTAPSVPAEIYSIPPSSPVYNVTYVTQTTTPTGIIASYTAGYFGSYVVRTAFGWWVVCGTGYYYPPYFYYGGLYPLYRPWIATYGVGAFYNPYTGAVGVARGVYGPFRGVTGFAAYNPYTGTYARGVRAYGPYGSAAAGRAYNPYTGVGVATRQASTPYGHWGTSVVAKGNQAIRTGHVSTGRGTIAGARSSSGAAIIAGSGVNGRGAIARGANGDLYAARNGQVYKRENGSWNTAGQHGANPGNRPQPSTPQVQDLNRDLANRQRGAAQNRIYQNVQRTGGYRGGGGFGRGGFGGRRGGGFRRR